MPGPNPPGDRSPSEPSPAACQVHAVLAWLVVEAEVRTEAGADADLHQVLKCAAGVSLAMQVLRARRAPSLGLLALGSPEGRGTSGRRAGRRTVGRRQLDAHWSDPGFPDT